MLTLNHVVDEQAASLAACPRPRALALAPSAVSWSAVTTSPVVVASRAGLGSVAAVRPLADVRPSNGYGLRRDMAGFGFGFGFATTAPAGAGALGRSSERGIGNAQDQQDKQAQSYLTHRREPRTWRPPH